MINANQITQQMINTYRFVQEYYYQEDIIARLKKLEKDTKDAALIDRAVQILVRNFQADGTYWDNVDSAIETAEKDLGRR